LFCDFGGGAGAVVRGLSVLVAPLAVP